MSSSAEELKLCLLIFYLLSTFLPLSLDGVIRGPVPHPPPPDFDYNFI